MVTKLSGLFSPVSVAVIGASREPGKVGNVVVKNLIDCGFCGRVYPVNPKADAILGLKSYKSIKDVPDGVDLAVICVPAPIVVGVAEECGEKGVKFLVVISAGFKEIGGVGAEREKKLLEMCKKFEMRLLGPNCLGLIETYTPLNVSFSTGTPKKGGITFISQSGALCTAVLDWSKERGIGFSKFVSLGNKADLDEADFIEAAKDDKNARVILLYLESVEKGLKFVETLRDVSKLKPVVILKGGTTEAGARAATSHTGAIVGNVTAYETAFKRANVILAENIGQLFDYAVAFATQPILTQDKIAIITNAGGPGILTADLCSRLKIGLAGFTQDTLKKLRKRLPPASNIYNPVDILGDARADRYEFAVDTVLSDDNVGGAIVILTPQDMAEPLETARALVRVRRRDKAVITAFMGGPTTEEAANFLIQNEMPCFFLPERAVFAIHGLVRYSEILMEAMEKEEPVTFYDVDKAGVRRIIRKARDEERVVLLEYEAKEIMSAYGIPAPVTVLVESKNEAVEVARDMGYPVVLKIASPKIVHKTDVGGVVLNLNSDEEVRQAYGDIMNRVSRYFPRTKIYGMSVHKMVPGGKEVIIGDTRDLNFGHLLMFGLGGIYTDILKDFSFRLVPVTSTEARKMVQETKAYLLLRGVRGEPPSDVNSVMNVIMRISQLVQDFPEIVEMDINPLFVYREGEGCLALDVKMTLSK